MIHTKRDAVGGMVDPVISNRNDVCCVQHLVASHVTCGASRPVTLQHPKAEAGISSDTASAPLLALPALDDVVGKVLVDANVW